MEEGSLVRVIRDFLTLNDGELSVVKDEVLQIVQVVDRHWVRCQNVRDVGLVPKNNICPVDNVPHSIGKTSYFNCERALVSGMFCEINLQDELLETI